MPTETERVASCCDSSAAGGFCACPSPSPAVSYAAPRSVLIRRCPCSLGRNSQNDHQRSTARGRNLCLASSRPDRPLGVDGAEHQVSFRSLSCLTAIRAWFADVQTDARRRPNVERHLPGLARYGKKVAGGLSIAAPILSRRRPAHEERPPDPPYDEREESRAR